MSCDIYIGCEKCKSAFWMAQTGLSGFTFYSGEPKCMKGLGTWLRAHYLCEPAPRLMTEYCVEDWEQAEWDGADGPGALSDTSGKGE